MQNEIVAAAGGFSVSVLLQVGFIRANFSIPKACFFFVLGLGLCLFGLAAAADLYAKKMEIVRTAEGQVTYFQDSVRISDGRTLITAGWARVNESRGLAVIGESVVIENPDVLITADSCVYHMDTRRTELTGRVRVEQDSLVILAPALEYVLDGRTVSAGAGLVVQVKEGKTVITGERGSYDLAKGLGIVDQRPRMIQKQETDSVVVTAERMSWLAGESRAGAYGNVRVMAGGAEMSCESLEYVTSQDSGFAWGSPVLTDSVSRTTGDTVGILVREGNLYQVTIAGNATSRYRTQSGELIEVSGRIILVRLDAGKIDTIDVVDLDYGRVIRQPESGT